MDIAEIKSGTVRVRLLDAQDQILLVLDVGGEKKKANGETFIKRSGYGLPGGKMKEGESPLETARRELLEETGFEADFNPEPEIIPREDGHITLLFHAKNPRVVKPDSKDSDILDKIWINWKMAHGTLNFQGREYPIYTAHMPLIHQYFDRP